MEDPVRPSVATLMRRGLVDRRKAAIAAVLAHYEKRPEIPSEVMAAAPLTEAELNLMEQVLGIREVGGRKIRRITRNGYHALRGGASHRIFQGLCDRGLVTLADEWDGVLATATPDGFAAVVKAHTGAAPTT